MTPDDRRAALRAVRQRLESLRRSGLDRVALTVSDLTALDPTRLPEPAPVPIPIEAPSPSPPPPPPRPVPVTPRPEPPRPVPIEPKPPAAARPIPAAPSIAASLFGEATIDEPVLPPAERAGALASLAETVSTCVRCPALAATRTQTVFGTGSPTARLMFVGEAPGADEDRTGVPFVGRAGALLTDMITKGMGLAREDVYIANVLKSRPPENRNPLPDEVAHCLPYLERQIAIIRPEFLCLLGKSAVSALLETALPMNRLRGRWHRYRGIPTVVTWHPAYLLRNPAAKTEAWDDLKLLMQAMGLSLPGRRKST